jgi:hypothetical protein
MIVVQEQFTHPEEAFIWLRSMARGTEYDGWRYVEEEAGVTFYKKEVEGPGGKREIYKGVVVIGARRPLPNRGSSFIISPFVVRCYLCCAQMPRLRTYSR